MARIEILSGPEGGRIVELKPGTWRIGRAKDNDLALPVESVSGRHLEVTVAADGSIRFQDLGSTNGTFSGGVQVKEGEWFAGTELRLGGCALKHLAEGDAGLLAEAKADDGDARARAAALQGARRSPRTRLLAAVAFLLVIGGGLGWYFLRDANPAPRAGAQAGAGGAAVAEDPSDLLSGLGQFEDASAWRLGEGVSLRDGMLVTPASRARTVLLRAFTLPGGGLRLAAGVSGGQARAQVSVGAGEPGESSWAAWVSPPLGDGAVELALPEGARWFQVALLTEGAPKVRDFRIEADAKSLAAQPTPAGRLFLGGANLLLMDGEQPLLAIAGAAGAWSLEASACACTGAGEQLWTMSGEFAEPQALAEGGPVAIGGGASVEQSPGLLLGGPTRRLLVACNPAATWQGAEGGVRLIPAGSVRISWDLEPALTEAARLAREIVTATREQDDARLLAAAARLLREVPLDEDKTNAARQAQRDALARGQRSLAELQGAVSGALFVGAVEALEPLAARAERLAEIFAGTALGAEASGLGGALRDATAAGREAAAAAEAEWRGRLQGALDHAYPVIARWVAAQDAAASGGGR